MGRNNSRRFPRLRQLTHTTANSLRRIRNSMRSEPKCDDKETPNGDRGLDQSLAHLGDRLGLDVSTTAANNELRRRPIAVHAKTAESLARSIYYAPDMDGQADPGEVVWILVNTQGPDAPPTERAIVVVGRSSHTILGLLISPDESHKDESNWLDIGAGSWDEASRQCWVRLDKVLEVPELDIRRQGAVIPRQRFERIANRLRKDYGWV